MFYLGTPKNSLRHARIPPVIVCCCPVAGLFATSWTAARQAPLISTLRVCSDSYPVHWWCHPTISSSAAPFSFCLQSFPASGSFPMSQLCNRWPKYWSFSFNISPASDHPGLISFRMDLLNLLQSKGLSRVFFSTTVQKHQFFGTQLSSHSNSHILTWPLEKP